MFQPRSEEKKAETGENYIIRSVMIFTAHKII
jgi:hypothetical protein